METWLTVGTKARATVFPFLYCTSQRGVDMGMEYVWKAAPEILLKTCFSQNRFFSKYLLSRTPVPFPACFMPGQLLIEL